MIVIVLMGIIEMLWIIVRIVFGSVRLVKLKSIGVWFVMGKLEFCLIVTVQKGISVLILT